MRESRFVYQRKPFCLWLIVGYNYVNEFDEINELFFPTTDWIKWISLL